MSMSMSMFTPMFMFKCMLHEQENRCGMDTDTDKDMHMERDMVIQRFGYQI
jgi:hypothetical protein